jgi:hypothetical protein
MNNENPFLSIESSLGDRSSKTMLAKALREAELSLSMQTGQYSEYHTEGEKVADHYRLIFNVMRSILVEDENVKSNSPKQVENAIQELDDSIKDTIKHYPNLLRYIVLTHDIAKRPENRTFNLKKFKMPNDEEVGNIEPEVMQTAEKFHDNKTSLETEISALDEKIKDLQKEIKSIEKAVNNKKIDPEQSVQLRQKMEEGQEAKKMLQEDKDLKETELTNTAVEFYDHLKTLGLSGEQITKFFGLGVGFVKHEEKSAEMVRKMDIPENIKVLLAKLADDHIVPLNRFADSKMDDNTAATFFDRTYGDYEIEEFKLSIAMAALDILGSVRKGENSDLTPINNILRGKRESWIKKRVAEELNGMIQRTLEEDSEYADLKNVDLQDKNTPIDLKKKYSAMRRTVEEKLKNDLRERYQTNN